MQAKVKPDNDLKDFLRALSVLCGKEIEVFRWF